MAVTNGNHVARLISSPPTAMSPGSDVSPGTQVSPIPCDYFSAKLGLDGDRKRDGASPPSAAASTDASTVTLASISEEHQESHVTNSRQSSSDSRRPLMGSRKSSSASVTFRQPRDPSLPQGNPRKTDQRRLRASSPSPVR